MSLDIYIVFCPILFINFLKKHALYKEIFWSIYVTSTYLLYSSVNLVPPFVKEHSSSICQMLWGKLEICWRGDQFIKCEIESHLESEHRENKILVKTLLYFLLSSRSRWKMGYMIDVMTKVLSSIVFPMLSKCIRHCEVYFLLNQLKWNVYKLDFGVSFFGKYKTKIRASFFYLPAN